jgi:GNAT superfamily N-acetyltransferase
MISADRFTDPAAFLAAAEPLLAADPARSTVIATVVTGLVRAPDPAVSPLLVLVRDGDDVAALGMRTPPHPLALLSDPAFDRPGVIGSLADAVLAAGPVPQEVTGPRPDVAAFAGAVGRATGRSYRERMPMLLYRLASLVPPLAVPGAERYAEPGDAADRALMAEWLAAFATESGAGTLPAAPDPALFLAREARGARHLLWTVPGDPAVHYDPVALAGHSAVVGGMARIGPVYTPPAMRRRGFGAAVTAAAVRSAQRAGATEVVLFTDIGYAPSNAVYRRLGFQPVEEFGHLQLRDSRP